MKKFKSLIAVLLICAMLFTVVGCAEKPQEKRDDEEKETKELTEKTVKTPDYDAIIDDFTPTELNTFELSVGEEATATFGTVAVNGKTVSYSSDESVVTVTDLGKVTAVGEGSAYVILSSVDGNVSVIYRYDVYDEVKENNTEGNTEENTDISGLPEIPGVDFAYEIEHFVPSYFNTQTLKIGDGHTPSAAGWTQVGGKCYTSDVSVVEVATNGNVFAKGVGTAYVVITGIGGLYEIYKYEVIG